MNTSTFTRRSIGAGQTVAVGAASAQSATFPDLTQAVRCVSTVDCWIEIGANPTAVATTSFYLPAGSVEYFSASYTDKIAVIQASGTGSLYVRAVN
jgi:hypothetical protein